MSEDAYQTVATPTEGETSSPIPLTWIGANGEGEDLTAYSVDLVGRRLGDPAAFVAMAGTKANQSTAPGDVDFDFAPVSSVAASSGTYLCQMRRTATVGAKVTFSQELFQVVVRQSAAAAA